MVKSTRLAGCLVRIVSGSANRNLNLTNMSNIADELPVARAAVLKHTLRSMHRMMQSSGTAEGLRGLIDSSILKSLKKIIEHRALFGPSVVPIGRFHFASLVFSYS
jgi:hypothetical protein